MDNAANGNKKDESSNYGNNLIMEGDTLDTNDRDKRRL